MIDILLLILIQHHIVEDTAVDETNITDMSDNSNPTHIRTCQKYV